MASPAGLGGNLAESQQQRGSALGLSQQESQAGPSRPRATRPSDSLSLFDGSHIPTILPRISRLSSLIVEASNNARSLTAAAAKEGEEQGGTDASNNTEPSQIKAPPSPEGVRKGINVALGASTDDDDATAGYETALSLSFSNVGGGGRGDAGSGNAQPSALAQSLVRESMGLRDAFANARGAIDALEGGDMDIDEQERLIAVLERYSEVQRSLGKSIYEKGAFASGPSSRDVEMQEATS